MVTTTVKVVAVTAAAVATNTLQVIKKRDYPAFFTSQ